MTVVEAVTEPEAVVVPVKKARAPRKPKVVAVDASAVETATVPVSAPEPVNATAPEPVPAPLPEAITTEPVVIADPNKPKKGGWWAKAKATLGG
jgi:ribonuclease E